MKVQKPNWTILAIFAAVAATLFVAGCAEMGSGNKTSLLSAAGFRVRTPQTPKQQEMYHACLAAMAAGETQLKAGTLAKDVYRAVHQAFADRQLADYFPHHAGHGIGLGHPEAPFLVSDSSDTLVAGDVVTLEPGLYIKGLCGMRFERNYLITASGYELLSKHQLTLEPS